MSYTLTTANAASGLRTLSTHPFVEGVTPAQDILDSIGVNGLGTRLNSDGSLNSQTDVDDLFSSLGGAESQSNLNTLTSMFRLLQDNAEYLNQALFKERLMPYLQKENRSVQAAFSRRSNTSVSNMLAFILTYVHKDIKHPIRTLVSPGNGGLPSIHSSDYSHTMGDEIRYSESETGTYHTLITPDAPAASTVTWSVYIEDTPLIRRYLRYIDHLSIQHGVRVVYCPKTFGHLEELDSVCRPTFTVEDDRLGRRYPGPHNYRALFVSLAFVYTAFSPFTRVETEVQPGQRVRDEGSMSYTPVVSEYLDAFVQVLKQLGAFSICKIYYKASRTPVRL